MGKIQTLTVIALILMGCRQEAEERQGPGPPRGHAFLPSMPEEPVLVPAAEARAVSCSGGEGLTILLDGESSVDSAFRSSRGQPAIALEINEEDRVGLILVDVGVDPAAYRQNLSAWASGVRNMEKTHRALVLSHGHTYASLMRPARGRSRPADALTAAWKLLGEVPAIGPNLDDICGLGGAGAPKPAAKLCALTPHSLKPGLVPLTYADGAVSSRVWFYTWAINPEERAEIPFQPLETAVIIAAHGGYVVYTVCSHLAMESDDASVQELHIAERVADLAAAGKLPAGPVHTIVTGLCGVLRTFAETSGGAARGAFDKEEFVRRLERLRDKTGLRRLYLSHCGLGMDPVYPLFQQVLGEDNVRLALPGSCISLADK